ncbi:MAG: ABC transporter permease, partial [Armatimonadetes bacterium]|nr:ABC transporter permease [Armatimonadota bacterium]NIM23820.1 ABC transporter permease [Armatimonadota bacterium]NIM67699.1 ABC transporter permease [Armatimonadota bacterium]NIM76209.1 ABC transporter permease [Armatimonadota bacterium]NIN05901.1 ABC transporter permease [Armatimonadota bacterium]
SGEAQVWEIIGRSLLVSGLAVVLGSVLGIPFGAAVALRRFPGKRLMVGLLNLGMAFPPVVVGLFVYLLLSRSGPLGFMQLLFSPSAMILAQVILAAPVVAALTFSALAGLDPA